MTIQMMNTYTVVNPKMDYSNDAVAYYCYKYIYMYS